MEQDRRWMIFTEIVNISHWNKREKELLVQVWFLVVE